MNDTVKQKTLIETKLLRRGSGQNEASPVRIITQWWTQEGEMVTESDPCTYRIAIEDLCQLRSDLRKFAGPDAITVLDQYFPLPQ